MFSFVMAVLDEAGESRVEKVARPETVSEWVVSISLPRILAWKCCDRLPSRMPRKAFGCGHDERE